RHRVALSGDPGDARRLSHLPPVQRRESSLSDDDARGFPGRTTVSAGHAPREGDNQNRETDMTRMTRRAALGALAAAAAVRGGSQQAEAQARDQPVISYPVDVPSWDPIAQTFPWG